MKLGLIVVAVLVASGCASSNQVAFTAKAPQKPQLRTARNSDAPVVCARHPSQIDLDNCAYRHLLSANARFNREVTALWPGMDATTRRSFVRGQRAWVRYRDNECRVWRWGFRGGSIAPLIGLDCEVALTRARIMDLAGMRALVPG